MTTAPEESSNAESTGSTPAYAAANAAAWLLVVAFVGLVLAAAVPAMTEAGRGDVAAALLFMAGTTAALVGTGLALTASTALGRTVFGALVVLAGLVLLFGIVPTVAALAVVLLGVAIEIGSLPGD